MFHESVPDLDELRGELADLLDLHPMNEWSAALRQREPTLALRVTTA